MVWVCVSVAVHENIKRTTANDGMNKWFVRSCYWIRSSNGRFDGNASTQIAFETSMQFDVLFDPKDGWIGLEVLRDRKYGLEFLIVSDILNTRRSHKLSVHWNWIPSIQERRRWENSFNFFFSIRQFGSCSSALSLVFTFSFVPPFYFFFILGPFQFDLRKFVKHEIY